jgi:hypothetical protein
MAIFVFDGGQPSAPPFAPFCRAEHLTREVFSFGHLSIDKIRGRIPENLCIINLLKLN